MRHMVGLFCYKHWSDLATGGNWHFFLETGFIFSFVWHVWTNQPQWHHGHQIVLAYILKLILLETSSWIFVSGKCTFSKSKTSCDIVMRLKVFLSENLKNSAWSPILPESFLDWTVCYLFCPVFCWPMALPSSSFWRKRKPRLIEL